MKPNLITFIYPVIVLAFLSFISACKKDRNDSNEKPPLTTEEAASFNNSITPGLGNIFTESKLQANQVSQQLGKLAYKGDSLYFIGSTNHEAKANSLHTMVMAGEDDKFLVTEYLPDNASIIMYTVSGKVKGRVVIKTTMFSATEKEVSLLDYNWNTSTYEVLTSIYYKDNKPAASGSLKRSALKPNVDGTICGSPTPSGSSELDSYLDNEMKFIACNGTHPINAPIVALEEKLKNMQGKDELEAEMSLLESLNGKFANAFAAIKDKMANYKFSNTPAGRGLDWIKALLKEYIQENTDKVWLTVSPEDSDLEFNEGTDKELSVTFKIIDVKTQQAYTKSGVLVEFGIWRGNGTALYSAEGYTSKTNGKVTFKLKPDEIDNLNEATSLQGFYDFKSNNLSKFEEFGISFKWLVPNISLLSGDNQMGDANTKLKNPLRVKIVSDDGKPIAKWPVSWTVTSGNGFLVADSETNAAGIAEAAWTIGTDETQTVEASAKKKNGSLANGSPIVFTAKLVDSLELYRQSILGRYDVSPVSPPGSTEYCTIMPDGRAQYTVYGNPSWADGTKFGASWSIVKINNRYYYSESGFWHPGFPDYEIDHPLTYPVTSFRFHNNTTYAK